MPSSYTPILRLTLPATGELTGVWGTTVNNGITSLIESSISGTASITMTDADYTLTVANGATDESRSMFVTLTGTLTAARNVICPAVSKLYFVHNNTTGGYAITFKTSAGTGISVPNGTRMVLRCNGTDVVDSVTSFSSLSLATPLDVSSGGTGGTTASAARTNLGGTTVGANFFTLTNPSAITFPRINADNSVSALDAATFRTAIGAGTGGGDVTAASANAFTGANTFYNTTGQTFGTDTSTQDGIVLAGRAGGSSSYRVTLTPTTLSASRTLTLPDASTTVVGTDTSQTLTNKSLVDPQLTLGGTNGTAGQVAMSQGAGLPPVWGVIDAGVEPFSSVQFFTASTTWTPPKTGTYRVTVVGGGGSGGAYRNSASAKATGGGAGGLARSVLDLSSSTTYTITIGAGGAGVARTTNGGTNGNAGGASSFSGSGITTMTANGGAGGTAGLTDLVGATGGTATGGQENYTGGGSGSCTGFGCATGGGAVAWRGVGYSSGNATATQTGGRAITGGAGVGGRSADVTETGTGTTGSGGGGSGSPSTGTTGGGSCTPDAAAYYLTPINCVGTGSAAGASNTSAATGFGAGSGASRNGSGAVPNSALFGGIGGVFSTGSAVNSNSANLGNSSGGVATNGSYDATSGAGGDGFIVIEWV